MVAVRNDRVESYVADSDLRTKQFYCLIRENDGHVDLAGANARVIGILQNEPNINEAATVCQSGSSRVVSDGSGTAIAPGDPLISDGSGKAVKAGTDKDHVFGFAMDASAADGTVIGVDIAIYDLAV